MRLLPPGWSAGGCEQKPRRPRSLGGSALVPTSLLRLLHPGGQGAAMDPGSDHSSAIYGGTPQTSLSPDGSCQQLKVSVKPEPVMSPEEIPNRPYFSLVLVPNPLEPILRLNV